LAGLQGQTIDSTVHEFRVHYEPIFNSFNSFNADVISAGGHMWQVIFSQCGEDESGKAEYLNLSVRFKLLSKSSGSVYAMFDTFLLHGNGQPRHVNLGTCFV
jgi:hypothetical protein